MLKFKIRICRGRCIQSELRSIYARITSFFVILHRFNAPFLRRGENHIKRCLIRACFTLPSDEQEWILEPLCFPEQPATDIGTNSSSHHDMEVVTCVLCSHSAPLSEKDRLLKHLVLVHKLVIADVKLIADFPKYVSEILYLCIFEYTKPLFS